MLVSNEAITTWELQFWRQSPAGPEQQYYTVRLTNANIASITFHSPNTQDPNLKFPEYEEVAFTYQQIEWIWTDGDITAQDSWEAAVR